MLIDSFKTESNTPDVCLTVFARVKLNILFYTIPKNTFLH